MGKSSTQIIYNVQALRALAAVGVLLDHLPDMLIRLGPASLILTAGRSGVDIFFVISGFVMSLICHQGKITPRQFLIDRWSRVAPLYWLATLLVFALAALAPRLMQATVASPVDFLDSLLFIPTTKSDGTIRPMLFVGWTINYEMFFYTLFAIAKRITSTVRVAEDIVIITLSALVASGAVYTFRNTALFFFSSPIVLEFALGILVARIYALKATLGQVRSFSLLLGGLFWMAIEPLLPVIEGKGFQESAQHSWSIGLAAAAILLGALSLEKRRLVVRNRFIHTLGASSYALYLIHPFVIRAGARLSSSIDDTFHIWIATAVTCAAAISLAIAVHIIIEIPMTNRLRSFVKGLYDSHNFRNEVKS